MDREKDNVKVNEMFISACPGEVLVKEGKSELI